MTMFDVQCLSQFAVDGGQEVAQGVGSGRSPGNTAFVELGEEVQDSFQNDTSLRADGLMIRRRRFQQAAHSFDLRNAATVRDPSMD